MKKSTTARTPIYKDVTPDEMMRLRIEDGLSNKEIAELLEISVVTVRKYIGPQGFKKSAAALPEKAVESSPSAQAPSAKRLLHVTEQTLVGAVASYTLSPTQGQIAIKAPTVEALLSFKDAVLLAEEFQEALTMMAEMEAL